MTDRSGTDGTWQALHRAAQYVAAAGIGYLPARPDDGHTTLLWNADRRSMVGAPIPDAGNVGFEIDVPGYAIACVGPGGRRLDAVPLAGSTHDDIVSWCRRNLVRQGADGTRYRFTFHYDLPAHSERGPFPPADDHELTALAAGRTTAHEALSGALADYPDTDPARIWPHHFDSGALVTLARDERGAATATIGLGLAVPDGIVPEHYLYVSPWRRGDPATVDHLPPPGPGRWLSGAWTGAVLELGDRTPDECAGFFRQALAALQA